MPGVMLHLPWWMIPILYGKEIYLTLLAILAVGLVVGYVRTRGKIVRRSC